MLRVASHYAACSVEKVLQRISTTDLPSDGGGKN